MGSTRVTIPLILAVFSLCTKGPPLQVRVKQNVLSLVAQMNETSFNILELHLKVNDEHVCNFFFLLLCELRCLLF